jgi:flagellin-like hook-associated protein FlgL
MICSYLTDRRGNEGDYDVSSENIEKEYKQALKECSEAVDKLAELRGKVASGFDAIGKSTLVKKKGPDEAMLREIGEAIDNVTKAFSKLAGLDPFGESKKLFDTSKVNVEMTEAALKSLKNRFDSFLRHLDVDWSVERGGSTFTSFNNGITIINKAMARVNQFRTEMGANIDPGLDRILDETSKRLKELSCYKIDLYDGGKTWGTFWEEGDKIIELLRQVPRELSKDKKK